MPDGFVFIFKKYTFFHSLNLSLSSFFLSHSVAHLNVHFTAKPNYNAFNIHTADEIINQFADIHELLGKAMVNVSS